MRNDPLYSEGLIIKRKYFLVKLTHIYGSGGWAQDCDGEGGGGQWKRKNDLFSDSDDECDVPDLFCWFLFALITTLIYLVVFYPLYVRTMKNQNVSSCLLFQNMCEQTTL